MIQLFKDIIARKPFAIRHRSWRKIRREHLKENPECSLCGAKKRLEVHHIIPVHIAPDLELRRSNLMTLCRGKGINCHLIAHRGNWKDYNSQIHSQTLLLKMTIWGKSI